MSIKDLSDADLEALAAGNMQAISDEGLQLLAGQAQRRQTEPAGFGERAARGAFETAVLGPAQLMARPVGLLGQGVNAVLPGAGDYLERVPGAVDQQIRSFDAQSDSIAPDGMDWGRMTGSAIPAAVGGTGVAARNTLKMLLNAGGAGAIAGGMTPVTSEDFWRTKAQQTVIGTGGGVIGGAVAKGLAQASGAVLARLRSLATRRPVTEHQIRAEVDSSIAAAGLDPTDVSANLRTEMERQVAAALRQGRAADPRAIGNAAAFERVGAAPTVGQVTQNPTQFAREHFLRQTDDEMQGQFQSVLQAINSRLSDMARGAGVAPVETPAAGQVAMDALQAVDDRLQSRISALYERARQSPDAATPINAQEYGRETYRLLKDQTVWESLPPGLQSRLVEYSKGDRSMTVAEAQDFIKLLNGRYGQATGTEGAAVSLMKSSLDDFISAAETNAGKEFRHARRAARARFRLQDAVPALKSVVDGDIPADKFMQKFVYASPTEELKRMASIMRGQAPEAWGQIRAQVIDDMRRAAGASTPNDPGVGGGYTQAGFAKFYDTLERSGKLRMLFDKDELKMLQAIRRVGKATQQGPRGVSYTGFGGGAQVVDLLGQVLAMSNSLPRPLAATVNMTVRPLASRMEAIKAQGTPDYAPHRVENLIPPEWQYRLGGGAAAGLPSATGAGERGPN